MTPAPEEKQICEYGNYMTSKSPRCTPEMKQRLLEESKKWPLIDATEKWMFKRQWMTEIYPGVWGPIPFVHGIKKERVWIVGLKLTGRKV